MTAAKPPCPPHPALLTVRFTGGRYTDGHLDTDALKSIIALEKCLQAIAISLWKKDHPGKRLPNGFRKEIESAIKLKITSVTQTDETEPVL